MDPANPSLNFAGLFDQEQLIELSEILTWFENTCELKGI